METDINRKIESVVFDYLPDVYLYYALFRCIDIVKSEKQNVSDAEIWNLITYKYDFLAGIILKDNFSVELNSYRPIDMIEKYSYLNKINLSGYYDYGGDIKIDFASYYDNNRIEINQLGLEFKEFVKACALYSYKKVRDRIVVSKDSNSFVLHLFTSSDRNTNLNIYLSLKAFINEKETIELFNKNLIREYIHNYIKEFDLEVIDKEKLPLEISDSDFVVGLSSSLVYGIDVENISESISNPKIISGTFWVYDRKKPSFYSAAQPTSSMIHPAMINLSKCFQINLKYKKV